MAVTDKPKDILRDQKQVSDPEYIKRYRHEFINYYDDALERLKIAGHQIQMIDQMRGDHIIRYHGFLKMMLNHLYWVHLDIKSEEL